MYCSKCGCQVSDDINFCPKCGAAILKTGQIQGNVDTAPTITEEVTSSPAEETKSPEYSENDNNKPEKFEQVKNEQEKSDSIGIVY